MLTGSAARSLLGGPHPRGAVAVASVRELVAAGWTSDAIRGQVRARRWQRIGRAVLLHNGEPTAAEQRAAALIVLGPRAVVTAFTALAEWGLQGWEREPVHVLVPRGARVVRPPGLPLRVHYTDRWRPETMNRQRRLHRVAPSAVLAASTFPGPRAACGILAACVQQRLVRPADLIEAVRNSVRVRHRRILLAAAYDIEQGAHALSEIDFARLCRSAGLPLPKRQAIRTDAHGHRRYLDVEWTLPDGRRVVAEIDGALHLIAPRWWNDELRRNEFVLTGAMFLRYPSVIVRCEGAIVIDQLRRALL